MLQDAIISIGVVVATTITIVKVVRPVLCIHKYFLRRYQSRPPITASSVVNKPPKPRTTKGAPSPVQSLVAALGGGVEAVGN
jgi:hypothetical protein